jgi:hypothetical protein
MTEYGAKDSAKMDEQKVQKRDWILLPILGLITVCLIASVTELIARRMFTYSATGLRECSIFNDPMTGPRGIPGCVSWDKELETQPIEYRLNSDGYRSDTNFGPKVPGTFRIVMVGSSIAMGYGVENNKSFASLLPGELSTLTGLHVELLNESFAGGGGVTLRMKDVLDAHPDMILWILSPWDIEQGAGVVHHVLRADTRVPFRRRFWSRIKSTFTTSSSASLLTNAFDSTRTAFMLRHVLFESQSQYVNSYLMAGDKESGFLKAEPSSEWKERLQQFSNIAIKDEERAKSAGTPIAVVLVPSRAQAAMISMGAWPTGYDPYKLDEELRAVVTSDGGFYIDILPGFRHIPDPEQYYFPVDGHVDANGHSIISHMLADQLTDGVIPHLKATAEQAQIVSREH